ncbi:MAG: Fur family transcriptional regulator [Candidatus Neomarinimicrobiota bacterium]|jgi:Fur family ferric uptake transcriptional regulator
MDAELIKNRFKDFLRSKGKNITPERMDILSEVLNQKGHFKIEDIILKMSEAKNPISRATVYRSIKKIEEAGLIKYIRISNDEKVYEIQTEHHDHMICEKCGNIIEFHNEELEILQNAICRSFAFTPHHHTMKIFGLCEKCKK